MGEAQPDRTGDDTLRKACLASLALLLATTLLALAGRYELLTRYFLLRQDLAGLAVVSIAIATMMLITARGLGPSAPLPNPGRAIRIVMLTMVVLVAVAGHHAVLGGHRLSRDEQMAIFDATIFASGRWAGMIPGEWAALRDALNTVFIDPALSGAHWASAYKPMNAMLHVPALMLDVPEIVSPALLAIAIWATWRCALRLWPEEPSTALVAALMMALSAQALTTAMTSYAMNALLAINMLWLLLVLQDRTRSHVAALVLGLIGTGLHQTPYHPVFALPILVLLVIDRRWAIAAVYAAAYAGFILFWELFAGLRADWAGLAPAMAPPIAIDAASTSLAAGLIGGLSFDALAAQAANLVRFLTWQHLLFLPLLLIGAAVAVGRRDRWLLAILGALLFVIILKTLHRPYQGHGWGYRYAHGALGAAALICAAGWRELVRRGEAHARIFVLASAATLIVLIPLRLAQAHRFSEAYAAPARIALDTGTEIVIVDNRAAPFAQDLVINGPFLRDRPVWLLASALTEADIARLCRRGSITTVGARELAPIKREFGISVSGDVNSAQIVALARATCPPGAAIAAPAPIE